MQFRSDLPQKADEFFDGLEKRVADIAYRAAVKTTLVAEARVKGIVEQEAFDTGRALRSVTSEVRRSVDAVVMTTGTNLDYFVDIEFGRKPGKWPNLSAIVAWAGRQLRRQGVNTRVNVSFDQLKALARTGGKPATAQQKAYRQHLDFVFLVGRKIATKGIRQKLIFKRLEPAMLAYYRKEVQAGLAAL